MSSPTVLIREIEGLNEVRAVEELQKEVWGMHDRDITPLTHLVAVRDTGGQLIGAFDGETLIGFVYGFLGIERRAMTHHSQMLAVKPAYRNLDVGYRLKLAQRERVLAQGITRITWTFDPLQSLNAYFNFRKLGGMSDSYRVNFYGEDSSSFLHRAGTDRLWLTWLLHSPRVLERLRGTPEAEPRLTDAAALLRVATDASPEDLDLHPGLSSERALIEIPGDINTLQREHPERAVQWRAAARRAFSDALAAGFVVVDFFRGVRGEQSVGVYLLSRQQGMEAPP